MRYFLIVASPDRNYVSEGHKRGILEAAAEQTEVGAKLVGSLKELDNGNAFAIIRGEIVMPKPVKVVLEYQLD